MAKSKFTEEDKALIRKLHDEQKLPYAAIAFRFGVAPVTINRICRPDYAARSRESNKVYRAKNMDKDLERNKKNYRRIILAFSRRDDKSILDKLGKEENMVNYIRQLILADIQTNESSATESSGDEETC